MSTSTILKVLHVFAWIVFIALLVESGALLVSFAISVVVTPDAAHRFYQTLNLSGVLAYDPGAFAFLAGGLAFVSVLKAYLFYLLVELFTSLNVDAPFNPKMARLISTMGYTSLAIGALIIVLNKFVLRLQAHAVEIPSLRDLLNGEGAYLMLGSIIFVISVMFKRGIELQTENDLTI
jgi:hypothetical protein